MTFRKIKIKKNTPKIVEALQKMSEVGKSISGCFILPSKGSDRKFFFHRVATKRVEDLDLPSEVKKLIEEEGWHLVDYATTDSSKLHYALLSSDGCFLELNSFDLMLKKKKESKEKYKIRVLTKELNQLAIEVAKSMGKIDDTYILFDKADIERGEIPPFEAYVNQTTVFFSDVEDLEVKKELYSEISLRPDAEISEDERRDDKAKDKIRNLKLRYALSGDSISSGTYKIVGINKEKNEVYPIRNNRLITTREALFLSQHKERVAKEIEKEEYRELIPNPTVEEEIARKRKLQKKPTGELAKAEEKRMGQRRLIQRNIRVTPRMDLVLEGLQSMTASGIKAEDCFIPFKEETKQFKDSLGTVFFGRIEESRIKSLVLPPETDKMISDNWELIGFTNRSITEFGLLKHKKFQKLNFDFSLTGEVEEVFIKAKIEEELKILLNKTLSALTSKGDMFTINSEATKKEYYMVGIKEEDKIAIKSNLIDIETEKARKKEKEKEESRVAIERIKGLDFKYVLSTESISKGQYELIGIENYGSVRFIDGETIGVKLTVWYKNRETGASIGQSTEKRVVKRIEPREEKSEYLYALLEEDGNIELKNYTDRSKAVTAKLQLEEKTGSNYFLLSFRNETELNLYTFLMVEEDENREELYTQILSSNQGSKFLIDLSLISTDTAIDSFLDYCTKFGYNNKTIKEFQEVAKRQLEFSINYDFAMKKYLKDTEKLIAEVVKDRKDNKISFDDAFIFIMSLKRDTYQTLDSMTCQIEVEETNLKLVEVGLKKLFLFKRGRSEFV